jgi:ribulose-phosphate 3-epimerase
LKKQKEVEGEQMGCVVPAILTNSPAELRNMVEKARVFTKWVQVDIMDGHFVPSSSITCAQIKEVAIPFGWEAHLMVECPLKHLDCLKEAGASKVIFHLEAQDNPQEVIIQAERLGLKVGLAVNPQTRIEDFIKLADKVDSILFLSVIPGFYGSKFIPEVLDKIKEFRRLKPQTETGIDGGVKANNIVQVAGCGVDKICVGSAVFLEKDAATAYKRLEELAASAV